MKTTRHAFTLIELILVVLIIGLVYSLALSSLKRVGKGEVGLDLENLETSLMKYHNNNHVQYLCLNRCETCYLFIDGKEVKSLASVVSSDVKMHRFDVIYGSQELELPAFFNADNQEEQACFRYEIFADGSRTEMMVETPEGVVDFAGKYHTTTRYPSLSDAISAKRELIERVVR